MNHNYLSLVVVVACAELAGCGSLKSADSPDVIYDQTSQSAKKLQIPPDLTDISNTEQFVLPGNTAAAVSRNTLLPQFGSARFVRQGDQSWLAFEQSPEDLWPQLLAFLNNEGYSVDQTEPTAGTIVTRWRSAGSAGKGGLLQNLIGTDEEYERIAFRLERDGSSARLFARNQASSEKAVSATDSTEFDWPADTHDPEKTSSLLARLLVFLGVEEQRVRGILNQEQANAVLSNAAIQASTAGSQLVINYGFQTSFERVVGALESLQYAVVSTDDGVGRIEFAAADEPTQSPLVISMTPQHVSAVTLSVTNFQGQRLDSSRERQVLQQLLAQLA